MLPSWSLLKEAPGWNPSDMTLNFLKEFPSIISAATRLNFLALRLYKFMLLPARHVALFSPLLAVLHELQLTSMWSGIRRSSQLLPGDTSGSGGAL